MIYRVTWEIDVEAENAEAAARHAHDAQLKDSSDPLFEVVDENGKATRVDLDEVSQAGETDRKASGGTTDETPAGYSVMPSVWDSAGEPGVSWMVFAPGGDRFFDDYGSRTAAVGAAWHHARTGEEPAA